MLIIERKDIEVIGDIMDLFPEAQSYGAFRLHSEQVGGIGSVLKLKVSAKVFDRDAELVFNITDMGDL